MGERRASPEPTLKRLLDWSSDRVGPPQAAPRIADGASVSGEQLDTIIYLLRALLVTLTSDHVAVEGEKGAPHHVDTWGMQKRYGLTARESEVLAEMAQGKSNRQIAVTLAVSVATVRSHVSNILSKMGAESRTEAAVKAVRHEGALQRAAREGRPHDVLFSVLQ